MDALELFLHQHALVHSSEVANSGGWAIPDSLLRGLTEEQMRLQPHKGMNSIVWLLWHMARTEDVAVNLILAGRPQVLHEEGWAERLGLSRYDIGTGMSDEEVSGFSERVDIASIRAYRTAVGRRTREVARSLSFEDLDQPVDAERIEKVLSDGALIEKARYVAEFWGREKKATILALPATGHNLLHLGEAMTVRKQLGL